MAVERIFEAFQKSIDGRFFILYGSGIEDAFISPRGQELNIEKALLRLLKRRGFERVAFVAPHKAVYFHDTASAQASRPPVSQPEPQAVGAGAASPVMEYLPDGPLGSRQLLALATSRSSFGVENAMGDDHALDLLDTIMQDHQTCRSAVVVVQAESWLEHFEDRRTLSGIIGSWNRLPSYNTNICVMLFSTANREDLGVLSERLPVPELRSLIAQGTSAPKNWSLIHISMPDSREMARVIQYGCQLYNLEAARDDIGILAEWMASENLLARQWLARFAEVDRIDIDTAKRNGWFTSVRDPNRPVEERLNALVGLQSVKERAQELAAWLSLHQQRKADRGLDYELPMLHMVFSGNPGTGKTTLARLMGEIFHDLGILRRGHLVEVKAPDLVAEFVGGTAVKTNRVVDSALDGVLFIDEAYSLTEQERGGYGQEAAEILLKRMEDDRERLVVIAAGYPDKMQHFLKSNPGLMRRFPQENQFDFPDYQPAELWQILTHMLAARDIPRDAGMEKMMTEMVAAMYSSRDETFGNGGEMRSLAEAVDRRRAYRIVKQHLPFDAPLSLEDIPEKYRPYLSVQEYDLSSVLAELDGMVGLEPVKSYIRALANRLQLDVVRRQMNPDLVPDIPLQHLVFTGAPGTGKTTAARIIGKIYAALGLLRRGHCVEVSRADLVAGFVGQTALKTREQVKSALDGVLFIDEAYALDRGGPADFGTEAIDTLVKSMEDFRTRFITIAAGYPKEIEKFLLANPGLKSRFGTVLEFPDFNAEELFEIFHQKALAEGYTVPPKVSSAVRAYLARQRLSDGDGFGNARSALVLFDKMKNKLAERTMKDRNSQSASNHEPSEQDLTQILTFEVQDIPRMKKQPAPTRLPRLQSNKAPSSNPPGQP